MKGVSRFQLLTTISSLLLLIISGCKKIDVPTVTTSEVVDISSVKASCGGEITNDGGSVVTKRGVCWSLYQNPSITGNYTIDSSGVGKFTSQLTGLTASTTFFVRAYATNIAGTGYGNEMIFTTSEDYRKKFIGYFTFSVVRSQTYRACPSCVDTRDTSTFDGQISIYVSGDYYRGLSAGTGSRGSNSDINANQRLTIIFGPEGTFRLVTPEITESGIFVLEVGYHYSCSGSFMDTNRITFGVNNLGSIGYQVDYYVSGTRK